jgi:2-phospho-L-lactate guanylyltransferase
LTDNAAVLVPVKAFSHAKLRLRPVLSDADRETLARLMAERVLAAAQGLPTAVVCDDREVADWAREHGAEVIWAPGRGLNGAVSDGHRCLAERGFDRVVVSHADLPFAVDLRPVAAAEGVTLVPDRHDDGTNVLCVPARAAFGFAYGRRSFARHRAEATRLGLAVRVLRDVRLGWDVDRPADLQVPSALAGEAVGLLPLPCR